ncbi:MAG TPA: class I SAM-dependent methyltransferase [Rhabdochlamydiaceae bacterium]|jgi:precorrin-6B methylase 2|nr:class I SAM-dependent methyltransferase [Rhabdochlamydiaceae bacterium]
MTVALGQKIYNCCRYAGQPIAVPARQIFKLFSSYLGFQETSISFTEATQRLLQQAEVWQKDCERYPSSPRWKLTREKVGEDICSSSYHWVTGDRKEFWDVMAQAGSHGVSPLLIRSLIKFEEEGQRPGLALELGSGSSLSVGVLLSQEWQVIAVDSSQAALNILRENVNEAFQDRRLREGQLQLVCSEIETFEFPRNVRLINAQDVLSYCNPGKIEQVWDQAYEALETGGRLVGNFFLHPSNFIAEDVWRLMGAWFTDKEVVKALLDHQRYRKEVCEVDKYWFEPGSRSVQFVGQKY